MCVRLRDPKFYFIVYQDIEKKAKAINKYFLRLKISATIGRSEVFALGG